MAKSLLLDRSVEEIQRLTAASVAAEYRDELVYTDEEKRKDNLQLLIFGILGMYSMLALGAIVWLVSVGTQVPESLISTLALSLGALAASAKGGR